MSPIKATPLAREKARLAALREYHILDTDPEDAFDEIAQLAARLCGTSAALITFVDEKRQWFKSHIGVEITEIPRHVSFCKYALDDPHLFVIPDASRDPRFADNFLVSGAPSLRFYAAAPLINPDGFGLGTLSILDPVPQKITAAQSKALTTLAQAVMVLLEKQRAVSGAAQQAREHETALSDVLHASPEAVIGFGCSQRICQWNPAAALLFGYSRAEALQLSWSDLLPAQALSPALHGKSGDALLRRRDGEFLAAITWTAPPAPNNETAGVSAARHGALRYAFVRDVTQQRKNEADLLAARRDMEKRIAQRTSELHLHQQFLIRVLDTDPNFIFVKNDRGYFTLANAAVAAAYGTTPDQLVGKCDADFNPNSAEVEQFLRDDIEVMRACRDKFIAEERLTNLQGEVRWVQTIKRPLLSRDGRVREVLGISTDITEQKLARERLTHQAFHDVLTGLPNRALFLNRLEHALAQSRRTREQIAVLFLDLDNFKVINDSLGHEAGDSLLREVAERLLVCVRPGDTVARIGGDEFTILLENLTEEQDAIRIAERIFCVLQEPVVLEGREVSITTSTGIAIGGGNQEATMDLLRYADTAMYEAKIAGKSNYAIFQPSMNDRAVERFEMEMALRQALEGDQLRLYYQPIVNLATEAVEGVEALVRWQHPQRGIISPDKFIAIAEETGLILPLGSWILHQACSQAKDWQTRFPSHPLVVSVNLSARQLKQPYLLAQIEAVLSDTGLEARYLKLEITESVVMTDMEEVVVKLKALRALGVHLAIDDFGTGYSSMSYLSKLPINTLKIDQSFVSRIGKQSEDTAIIRAIVSLAKALSLKTTCEGIETAQQHAYLKRLGCTQGQGYHYARPLPADAMENFFARPSGKWETLSP